MQQFTKTTTPLLPTYPINNVALEVNITEDFKQSVDYFCKQVPTLEWSGILFYTIDGDFNKDSKITITPEYIHLMDIGTGGYTEYDWDETALKLTFDKPELLGLKIGHIHSHNSMSTFFSGTDMRELSDNAPNYNQYFSLIVNNRLDMTAKLAVVGEVESTQKFSFNTRLNGLFKSKAREETKQVLFTLDAGFNRQDRDFKHSQDIKERFVTVQKEVDERKKSRNTTVFGYNGNTTIGSTIRSDRDIIRDRDYDDQLSFPFSSRTNGYQREYQDESLMGRYDQATIFYEADAILTSIATLIDPSTAGISHLWEGNEIVRQYKKSLDLTAYKTEDPDVPGVDIVKAIILENLDDAYLNEEFVTTYESVDADYNDGFIKFLTDMINVLKLDLEMGIIPKSVIKRLEEVMYEYGKEK